MDRSCVPCEVGCGGSGVVCAGRGGGMWHVQGGGQKIIYEMYWRHCSQYGASISIWI